MCGIAGAVSLARRPVPRLDRAPSRVMNELIAHRGPDGEGTWVHPTTATSASPTAG